MVIRMTDSSGSKKPSAQLRRTTKMRTAAVKNTRAEFKRLKTILPSIRRKENVSKLDIILEAIKYIDDLQDQLFDRLTGTHSQREAALLALTEQDMEKSRARLNQLRTAGDNHLQDEDSSSEEEDHLSDDNDSHASLEL